MEPEFEWPTLFVSGQALKADLERFRNKYGIPIGIILKVTVEELHRVEYAFKFDDKTWNCRIAELCKKTARSKRVKYFKLLSPNQWFSGEWDQSQGTLTVSANTLRDYHNDNYTVWFYFEDRTEVLTPEFF